MLENKKMFLPLCGLWSYVGNSKQGNKVVSVSPVFLKETDSRDRGADRGQRGCVFSCVQRSFPPACGQFAFNIGSDLRLILQRIVTI